MLLRAESRAELQDRLLEHAGALLHAECALLVARETKGVLVLASSEHGLIGRKLARDEDASGLALEARKSVVWHKDGGRPLKLDRDFASALALPFNADGRALVLSLYRREAFQADEQGLAEVLVEAIGPLWRRLAEEEARQAQLETQDAELRRQSFMLSQLKEKLAETDRLKAAFVASISHELRTPLNVVLGFGSLLADEAFGELNPQQCEACEKIMESSERLAGLINDLLDISSLQARLLEMHFGRVDVPALLQAAVEDIRPLAERKQQEVSLEVSRGLPELVADPDRLWQALKHLLDNAVKFTPPGGRIGVRAAYAKESSAIAVEVWDTGIGIPEAAMHKLFERFYQVDSSNTRLYGGTGIGLALVKELVERHGGTVTVESVVGRGSVFRLLLPLSPEGQIKQPSYRD
ncbi:MAG TPA: ATP-binding protein [Oscillatoriaceae cyanobacterium]